MTERGCKTLHRTRDELRIGPSALIWNGTTLTIHVDEITAPIPSRLKGQIRLHPTAVESRIHTLHPNTRHRWSPIAPCARAEIALSHPSLNWSGDAYLDTNEGDAPLESDFLHWNWSRTRRPGATTILYDIEPRHTPRQTLAMHYHDAGGLTDFTPPPLAELPCSAWGVPRTTRSDPGHPAIIQRRFENAPFYTRSLIQTRLDGQTTAGVHESLSLNRFRTPWVQAMLPFRMPRRAGAK